MKLNFLTTHSVRKVTLGACGILAVIFCSLAPAQAQTTLKIATIVPDGTTWMTSMREGVKEIENRTDGRVKFKIYAGGVQGNVSQVRRKMRVGQLHGGVFTAGGLGDFHADAELYALPDLFRDYEEVAHVREVMDQEIYARLESAGYVTFGFAGSGFAYLVSKTPVAGRSDMKNLKVWIPEGDQVARIASDALAINTVPLPLTDVLTGLQTELIDTVMGPPTGIIVLQWHTAVGHIMDLPLAYSYGGLLVDKRHFDKIDTADQAVVREVMERIYEEFNTQGKLDDKAAMSALMEEGLEIQSVSAAEREEIADVFRRSVRSAAEKGEFDIQLLDQARCLLESHRGGRQEDCG